jgi:RimJ/RimL family protein N-acetyltransferase
MSSLSVAQMAPLSTSRLSLEARMRVDPKEWFQDTVLTGRLVRLEPLGLAHEPPLWNVAQDPEVWRWLPAPRPRNRQELARVIADALVERDEGRRLPFAVIDRKIGIAVGSTSYLDIEPAHRRIEVGWTWFGRDWWGTGRNEESKLLMFRHAFEILNAQRVSLKTDARNERSQRAIERIGGVREGILRKHYLRPDGSSRDTVYFSVIDTEWPNVRLRLEALLSERGG